MMGILARVAPDLLKLVLFCIPVLTFHSNLNAAAVVLSDFDDTVLETRQVRKGTFKTAFKLFLIEQRANVLQPVPSGAKVIEVSPADFHRIKKYLGDGNSMPGSISTQVTLEDGQVISPGSYMMRDPDTFEYFNAAAKDSKRNYLLEDFIAAEKRSPENGWKGPFWDNMVTILSDKETAKGFGIITARGHTIEEWTEFFEYLKSRKYIKFLPNFKLFYNVANAEFEQYGLPNNIPIRKANVIEQVALMLSQLQIAPTETRLSPDGKEQVSYHSLVLADDNQTTIEQVIKKFQQLAQGQKVPVKFGVFNMGNRTEIEDAQRPQFSIIRADGTFRHATDAEKLGEPLNSCEKDLKSSS